MIQICNICNNIYKVKTLKKRDGLLMILKSEGLLEKVNLEEFIWPVKKEQVILLL